MKNKKSKNDFVSRKVVSVGIQQKPVNYPGFDSLFVIKMQNLSKGEIHCFDKELSIQGTRAFELFERICKRNSFDSMKHRILTGLVDDVRSGNSLIFEIHYDTNKQIIFSGTKK